MITIKYNVIIATQFVQISESMWPCRSLWKGGLTVQKTKKKTCVKLKHIKPTKMFNNNHNNNVKKNYKIYSLM